MSGNPTKFVIDSNILMEAHKRYYAFDLCPGFWESIRTAHGDGKVFSTIRVLREIERMNDPLTDWVSTQVPSDFFLNDSSDEVVMSYAPMVQWVNEQPFQQAAKAKFATDADGWLVALARTHGYCLVTHEILAPEAKKRIPMPNVCQKFGVSYCNTFEMLRKLACRYN